MNLITHAANSRAWFKPLAVILVVAMLLGPLGAALAFAQAVPTIMAENKTVQVGDTFDVLVTIKDASDLSAFQFSLDYDPQIVEVMDVNLGGFLTSTGRVLGGEVGPAIDGAAGVVTYGAFTNGMTPAGPDGAGTLAIVQMKALKAGFTGLNLFGLTTTDTTGAPQSPIGQGGSVNVVAPPPPGTVVSVGSTSVGLGAVFTVPVVINNAVDLVAYQFTIDYNPAILEFVDVENGPFLLSTGRAFGGEVGPSVDIVNGVVTYGAFTNGMTPLGPNGAGVLANVTFRAVGLGQSALDLKNVTVSSTTGSSTPPAVDGVVQVVQPRMVVDCSCSVERVEGEIFTVDIILENAGDLSAFEFTLNWDADVIELLDVELGPFLLSTGRVFGGEVGPVVGDGTLKYGAFTIDDNPPGPNGTGVIATLTFAALVPGSTVLDLADTTVSDTRGISWDTLRTDGCARVVEVDPSVDLVKTVGTEAGVCAATDEIIVPEGTTVYYCYTITNTGNIALTNHDLVDDQLGVLLDDFAFDLMPGMTINTVAAGLTASAVIEETTTNIATFTATNPEASAILGVDITVEDTDVATVEVEVPTAVELSDFEAGSAAGSGLSPMLLALLVGAMLVGTGAAFRRRSA